MKKFLLFFTSIVLSFLLINNKVFAQEEPPIYLKVVGYWDYSFLQENVYTYEYLVTYVTSRSITETIGPNDYFLFENINVKFRKGINRNTNSYEFNHKTVEPNITWIGFRVTVLKTLIDSEYSTDISPLFYRDTIMYINATNTVYDEYDRGYNDGYNEGYNEGYEDGYNDFNVADYFGDRNIAKDPYIDYGTASDAFEPTTAIVLINKGYGAPNILLDKSYLITIIKKNIYDHVVVVFEDYSPIYHYEATYLEIDDYDIYIFDFSDRINTKYQLEIRKGDVTTSEQLNKFLDDVKDNLYFSHASKLLNSSIASQLYHFGYLVGLEENISESDAYRIGYDTGYNRGYTDGNEIGYERGYEDGYEQGFDYGKTVEYEQGYNDGYNDGYSEGIKEPFYSNFHVWIVPAIIIVVIAGIFVGYRRERYGGE